MGRSSVAVLAGILFVVFGECSAALAGGFERNIAPSGLNAAFGGAAVSSVRGSESVGFNPAGLPGVRDYDMSLNLSPGLSKSAAPFASTGHVHSSDAIFQIPFSGSMSYGMGNFAAGFGVTDIANHRESYENVIFPEFPPKKGSLDSDLLFLEYGIGIGAKILDHMRVGVTWRITQMTGLLGNLQIHPLGFTEITATDLSGISLQGFRLGFQYDDFFEGWGIGLVLRNRTPFVADGNLEAKLNDNIVGKEDIELHTSLPAQAIIGVHFPGPKGYEIRVEGAWTQSNRIGSLDFQKTGVEDATLSGDVPANFSPTLTGRFGIGKDQVFDIWALRLGYAVSSGGTPQNIARPLFYPPGPMHSFSLGTGARIDEGLNINLALEASIASGDGEVQGATETLLREYFFSSVNLHMGMSYRF